MRAVKGANTRPEMVVRRFLWSAGLRYRLHDKKLPGKPDIVFPSKRIALFVHGCFWHGHEGCPRHRIPKTRTDYWTAKIGGNQQSRLHLIAMPPLPGSAEDSRWHQQFRKKRKIRIRIAKKEIIARKKGYNI